MYVKDGKKTGSASSKSRDCMPVWGVYARR